MPQSGRLSFREDPNPELRDGELVRDEAGRPFETITAARDVSERVAAEQADGGAHAASRSPSSSRSACSPKSLA